MEYREGRIGRIFLVKFNNGDILLEEIKKFAKEKGLDCACIMFIGALRKGDVVTGPKRPVIPPDPNWVDFKDGWEVLGIGTVFKGKDSHQIHIHSSMGRGRKTITGCLRKMTSVFLVLEAVCFELKGINAIKGIDPRAGINLLKFL